MIIIVMFFKIKEITFKLKLAVASVIKKYYSNPKLIFFRKRVISSFLPMATDLSKFEDCNNSSMSFKSFKALSQEQTFEDNETLMSSDKDELSKELVLDDSTLINSVISEEMEIPKNAQKSKFANFFIPQMHLILAENWKDGQSIIQAMQDNLSLIHI